MKQLSKTLLVILLSAFIQASAQPFFPFKLNQTTYYKGVDEGYHLALVPLDSQVNQQPKSYQFAPTFLPDYSGNSSCDANGKNNFWGGSILNYGDTLFAFFNFKKLPTSIKLNTNIGDKWIGYEDSLFQVEFSHDSSYLMLVNWEIDFIHSISIKVLNKKTNEYLNVYDRLIMGKYSGFVSFPCFYTFPYQTYSAMNTPNKFQLASGAIHNISWDSIYNFHVGDEFHTISIDYYQQYIGGSSLRGDTSKHIYEIIQRSQPNSDSLVFVAKHMAYRTVLQNGTLISTVTQDTVYLGYKRISFLDIEPGLFTATPEDIYAVVKGEHELYKWSYVRGVYQGVDSCFHLVLDAWNIQYKYINGLGGPYYEHIGNENGSAWNYSLNLVYYKKGDKTWGVPFPKSVGLATIQELPIANIYPNPTQGLVTISLTTSEQTQFTLFDVLGRVQLTQELHTHQTEINLSHLPKGVYYYTVANTQQNSTGKLVIK